MKIDFDVNTKASVAFSRDLEKLTRSALPVAIRETLNNAAFDLKQKTMPGSAGRSFVNRSKNFFKANSVVQKATGFDVNGMQATVGFSEGRLQGSHNHAVQDLEQQERGGTIKSRSFIPLNTARISGASSLVRPINRLSPIKNKIIDANLMPGKGRFFKAVHRAGKGGFVIAGKNKPTLFKVKRLMQRSNNKVEVQPLYSYHKGRAVNINSTSFMRTASMKTQSKLAFFYMNQAQRQFDKVLFKR